jgi:cytochrome c oxidase cbb3-type subunit III
MAMIKRATTAMAAAAAILAFGIPASAQTSAPGPGETLFAAQCGFCHGRDATGGAGGPDLTDSELVGQDRNGNKMTPVIRAGRLDRGMPAFSLSNRDLKAIVDYVHARKSEVEKSTGRRRKVSAADLATGSADAGRAYFEGAGACATCHSPTGDLAGVAARYRGLALLQRFLYPTASNATPLAPGEKAKPNPVSVTMTLPTGEMVAGSLVFRDEFTIAVRDADGWIRSWPQSAVKATLRDPLEAHAAQLAKYSDDDIHNVLAYLQTLK